jgi:hypothetical protein
VGILSILTKKNLIFYPSRIPDPGVKKAPDPGSGILDTVKTLVDSKQKCASTGPNFENSSNSSIPIPIQCIAGTELFAQSLRTNLNFENIMREN